MRFLVLLCFCVLLCMSAAAQNAMRYSGYVQFPDDPLVSYYLELSANGTRVSGYSITGYKTGSRLKASVEGYFKTPSDLIIRETGSLDGPENGAQTYCYFAAHLKLTVMMNGQKRWNGAFQSYQRNGVPCGSGTMTVTDNAPPLEKVNTPAPKIRHAEPPKPVHIAPAPKDTPKPPPPPPPPPPPRKDTPKKVIRVVEPPRAQPQAPPDSCQRSYRWGSDDFGFDVWDGWKPDGDVVSLRMNGELLLSQRRLGQEKQHFSVQLHPGLNVLYIELGNEGSDPPNTPNLTLFDGSKKYELAVSGAAGEVARICIWR
jgi:hypothetical protein